jgi:hypothetical protein
VIAELRNRAKSVVAAIKKHPTFLKEFELLDEEPTLIFRMRAAGVKGSEKASRLFADALGALRVRRLSDN